MTPSEIIRANISRKLVDENGEILKMTLEPGLTDSEVVTSKSVLVSGYRRTLEICGSSSSKHDDLGAIF